MCNMKSREKRETDDDDNGGKMTTQHFNVFTFSIARILDVSEACNAKLKFVYEKQLGGERH